VRAAGAGHGERARRAGRLLAPAQGAGLAAARLRHGGRHRPAAVQPVPGRLTLFVSTISFRIPAASIEEQESVPFNEANVILHQFIWIGAVTGVFPLPFWILLLGGKLLRRARGASA
jgi:hypothetical protein